MFRRTPAALGAPRTGRVTPWFVVTFALVTGGAVAYSSPDDSIPPVMPVAPAVPADADVRAATSPSLGQGFETPEAAAKALFAAVEANDDVAMKAIAGPGNDDIVEDGKDPIVRAQRAELARAATTKLTLEKQEDGRVLVLVGRTAYPLAIPLVLRDSVWRFDAAAGRDELLARRIGEHELEAIGVCIAYADAQVEYASKDRDDDGVKSYAQRLASQPDKKDGLYWESIGDEDPSPAGAGLTSLRDASNPDATLHAPFDGYYWRVLTAQGSNAAGGAYSYVINGRMIAGFALLAVPATHRNSGVMSFIVSNQGKVYQKDLGTDTLKVAAAIESFDPDATWVEVDEATMRAAAETSPDDAPFADKVTPVEVSTSAIPVSDGPTPVLTAPPIAPSPSTTPCPAK